MQVIYPIRGGMATVLVDDAQPYIRINITDEGDRIADEVRPHIFDAYYKTKPEGNGLGLAVSREITMNHGGMLEFESEETGTIFTLTLPMERTYADAA